MTMGQFPPPSDEPDTAAEGAGGAPDSEDLGFDVTEYDPTEDPEAATPEREVDPKLETRF